MRRWPPPAASVRSFLRLTDWLLLWHSPMTTPTNNATSVLSPVAVDRYRAGKGGDTAPAANA